MARFKTLKPKPRGLAALTPEERRRISILGGRAVQRRGLAPHFTPEEARKAGLKSGEVRRARKAAPTREPED